jgi:hypothetical protein
LQDILRAWFSRLDDIVLYNYTETNSLRRDVLKPSCVSHEPLPHYVGVMNAG